MGFSGGDVHKAMSGDCATSSFTSTPIARAALKVAQQRAAAADRFARSAPKGLRVGAEAFESSFVMQFDAGTLPVRHAKDLVPKLSATRKLVREHGFTVRPILLANSARLLDQLRSIEPGARSVIPVFHRRRPLFPVERATPKGG
jgi:hypothetical protein